MGDSGVFIIFGIVFVGVLGLSVVSGIFGCIVQCCKGCCPEPRYCYKSCMRTVALLKLNRITGSNNLPKLKIAYHHNDKVVFQHVLDCLVEVLIHCVGSLSVFTEILQDIRNLAPCIDNLRKEQNNITFLTYYKVNEKSFLDNLISNHPKSVTVTCSGMEISTPELIHIMMNSLSPHGKQQNSSLLKDHIAEALAVGSEKLVTVLLQFNTPKEKAEIFFSKHRFSSNRHSEVTYFQLAIRAATSNIENQSLKIESILNYQPNNTEKVRLIKTYDTALNDAIKHDSSGGVLYHLLTHFDQPVKELLAGAHGKRTLLQNALAFLDDEAIVVLLDRFTIESDEVYDHLMKNSAFALYRLVHFRKMRSLEKVLKIISEDKQFRLFTTRITNKLTCINLIRSKLEIHPQFNTLIKFWHNMLVASPHTSCLPQADARTFWDEVINHPDGLSGDEVMNLYNHTGKSACKSYIIPTNQQKLGMYGLVFSNMHNRPGAQEESITMVRALRDIDVNTEGIPWDDFHYLKTKLNEKVASVKDNCSLLIVSIMAHGFAGHVEGSYGSSHGEINTLFAVVEDLLPEFIPVVYILQMCQELRVIKSEQAESFDASASNISDRNHILLRRPNTYVLHSTVPDGKAVRGAYTGAIAKQISNSDGKTDIETMHKEAIAEVKADSRVREIKQHPRIDSTAEKELILPRRKSAGAASVRALNDEQMSSLTTEQSSITEAASSSSVRVQIEMSPQ